MSKDVWLIGAGYMACEYCKVLQNLDVQLTVIGRGSESAQKFEQDTGYTVIRGGVENFVIDSDKIAEYAIVAVYPMALKDTAICLIEKGVKHILLEKPGAMNIKELESIRDAAVSHGCKVYVGYNRRFYASVLEAKRRIENDGGITSINFEFTEWSDVVKKSNKPEAVLQEWFIANSTHVVDLAFYLGGNPVDISCYVDGTLPWYTKASSFAGAGRTDKGIIFSYKANWDSAGRWSVEALTTKHKYLFEPMEKLRMQDKGSVKIYDVELDDKLDIDYKPGIYLQTKAFLEDNVAEIATIEEQVQHAKVYTMMEQGYHGRFRDGIWSMLKFHG